MPKIKYAETVVMPGVALGPSVMGAVSEHLASRGYSLGDIGELYMRVQSGGMHVNFKVYERDGEEAIESKIGDGGHHL